MKAQTFKTKKTQQFIDTINVSLLLLAMLLIGVISEYAQTKFGNTSLKQSSKNEITHNYVTPPSTSPRKSAIVTNKVGSKEMSFISPVRSVQMKSFEVPFLEVDKLFQKNKDRELLYKELNSQISTSIITTNFTPDLARLKESLIPVSEPKLEFVILPNHDANMSEFTYIKNEYLENLGDSKLKELNAFYSSRLKLKESLVEETEERLQLEDWMVDEKHWSLTQEKSFTPKNKTVKK